MANEIGSVSFDIWQGEIHVPATVLQLLNRLGRDHARTRDTGIKDSESTIRTVEFAADNAAGLLLIKATYPALRGTIVTAVDSAGNSFQNVAVLFHRVTSFKTVPTDIGVRVRVAVEWTLKAGAQS